MTGVTLSEHVNKYRSNNVIATRRLVLLFVQQIGTFLLYDYLPVPLFVFSHVLCFLQAFLIFHDCGHGSFFTNPQANRACEYLLSFYTATPVDWSVRHDIHHGRSGNLSKAPSEWNDTVWLTKNQFFELPEGQRKLYEFIRRPWVFFTVAPFLLWEVQYRIPWIQLNLAESGDDRPEVFNSLVNTTFSAIGMYILYTAFGWNPFFWYCIALYISQSLGLLLFHTQHSFNPSYNAKEGWNRKDSAIRGSSLQTIPSVLKYWFMGIEYHHIHHYTTKVPGYFLQQCHEEAPEGMWSDINHLSYSDMWNGLKYTLYDDEKEKFISFEEAYASRKQA
eukprot:TRINITY_DN11705_c0_g1_i1.p1 TRINITY_DN11705_c0_g1~~TRINITY_DN11705_c0_g1_i1.p1  ORF type:complete len:333 (-),score=50.78 TRINITY_DN11705_c0_g1_i1:115-1113(-)